MARPKDKRRRKEGDVGGKRHVGDVTARPRLRGGAGSEKCFFLPSSAVVYPRGDEQAHLDTNRLTFMQQTHPCHLRPTIGMVGCPAEVDVFWLASRLEAG